MNSVSLNFKIIRYLGSIFKQVLTLIIMAVPYAQICSIEDQRPKGTSPELITMNQNDEISGISHSAEKPGDIRINEAGVYVVIAAPQVGRTSGTEERYVDIWLRRNGKDIPNSNVRNVVGTKRAKDVIVNQTMMSFDSGDVINVMMAVETANEGLGIEAIRPEGEPTIPSIIFSMHKIKEAS